MLRNCQLDDSFVVRDTVTVADVLDAGACIEGVLAFIDRRKNRPIAADSSQVRDRDGYIARASRRDGSGSGSGYGYGDGDGYGYGDGYGSGYGYGDGYGYGYGYGYGSGYGYGDGYGDGYGYGYGYGEEVSR
jgi:hypothetical protein